MCSRKARYDHGRRACPRMYVKMGTRGRLAYGRHMIELIRVLTEFKNTIGNISMHVSIVHVISILTHLISMVISI